MNIIPAIDIIDGACVRLKQGDYQKKTVYHKDPLDMAKAFEDAGISCLHLVDLDGAKQKKVINNKVLERIAAHTNLEIDFGGGIRNDSSIQKVFDAGATKVNIGSIALTDEPLFLKWLEKYGADKIILSADVRDGFVSTQGWLEKSQTKIKPYLKHFYKLGVKWVACTDISKDGMLQGTSTELYQEIRFKIPRLNLIASGGISSMKDIEQLQKMNLSGVIIGKAIYEGKISLENLSEFILKNAD
ncbi:MAG: 1-(5-phosphoribosyl)-5-[(5-phosphoribosylamino)methylideneamino]imidazole-4-carboxamide isomerase [Chitinophagales bacterium]